MRISTKRLEVLMADRGLTILALSKLSGISQPALAKIRARQSCRIGTAAKLCAALGCSAGDIVPDEKESEV